MRNRKGLCLLLCLTLVVGLLAGCGGSAAGSAASKTESAATTQAVSAAATAEAGSADPEETTEVASLQDEPTGNTAATGEVTALAKETFGEDAAPAEWTLPLDDGTNELTLIATFPDPLFASYPNGMADCQIYQEAEKATGVKMNYTALSTSASAEQFNVMLASGGYPDLIGWGLNYATGDDAAVDEGIYLDVKDYVAEYCPNYYELLSTDETLLKSALTDSGYLASFFALVTEDSLGKAGLAIRTDELEKLGLDKPYTQEEWETTLEAFKNDGIKEPLCMLAPGAIQDNWIAAAFDTAAFLNSFPMSVAPFYVQDGDVKFGVIEPGFKDYITLMHDWYEKGYISKDFVSANANWNGPDYASKVQSGDVGIFYTDWGNIQGYIDGSEVESFALEGTYDMHTSEDSINHFASYSKKSAGNGFHVTSNCENVELACKWGDWWYTDEGSMLANYGVEGVSYEMKDGVPTFTEAVTKAQGMSMRDALLVYASNNTICCVIDNNAVASSYSEVDNAAPEIWSTGMDDAYVLPSYVTLNAEEQTQYASTYSDIETLCLEYIAGFITGDKSMDDFDSFVSQVDGMGIQNCIDLYQAAYDRAMED